MILKDFGLLLIKTRQSLRGASWDIGVVIRCPSANRRAPSSASECWHRHLPEAGQGAPSVTKLALPNKSDGNAPVD